MTRWAIGADVGGTKIAAGLVELESGQLIERIELPTPRGQGAQAVIARISDAVRRIDDAAKRADVPWQGLGIGLPELVRLDGTPASQWIADWRGVDLPRALACFAPVRVESDVRLAALAELRYGHGRELASFIFVSVGTGLSCAVCRDDLIERGAHGFAIHFASSDLVTFAAGTGQRTTFNLEAFASGLGMSAAYTIRTGRTATARMMVEGEAGPEGEALLDEATTALASSIGQMINLIDPHGVVIGGGLGTAPRYFDMLRTKVPAYIWAEECRNLPFMPSHLEASAGVIGAAALHGGNPFARP